VFPPEETECIGFDNETLIVRFPQGFGMLRDNYTIMVDVFNPDEEPLDNTWLFETRKFTEEAQRYVIVDANRTLSGFGIEALQALRTEKSSASARYSLGLLSSFLGSTALGAFLTGALLWCYGMASLHGASMGL